MTIIRAFLSVNLGIEALRAIAVAQREARERCAAAGWDIAWVPPPNVHVILRYLGEISVALPRPLVTAMRAHVEPLPAFPLRARGMRAVAAEAAVGTEAARAGPATDEAAAGTEAPKPPQPARVVVPIVDETGGLERLQAALATPLQELGFKPLEPRPITEVVVARVVAAGSAPLEELLAPAAELDFGSSLVSEVFLYKSTAHAPKGEFVRLGYVSLLGPAPSGAARRGAPDRVAPPPGATAPPAAVESCPEPPEPEPLEDAGADLAEPQIVELDEPDDEEVLDEEVLDEGDDEDDEPDEEEPPTET